MEQANGASEVGTGMDGWTKWSENVRAVSTIIAVLVLVSVLAAVCVKLLSGI